MTDDKRYILWLDLEAEGLIPADNDIWEVAAKLTDAELNVLDEFQAIWAHDDYGGQFTVEDRVRELEKFNPYVYEMHVTSGLLESWLNDPCPLSYKEMDDQLCEFTSRIDEGLIILAGSSVGYDHKFINYHLPKLSAKLSHHHLDISSVKLFMNLIKPNASDKYRNDVGNKHRAMDDITRDLNWAQNYREVLVKWIDAF